jgi:cell division protein FtsB
MIFGHNGLLKYKEMLHIQKEYQQMIENMEEKIVFLEWELDLMKNNKDYMDYLIRRDTILQMPGEDQYIIRDNATVPSK